MSQNPYNTLAGKSAIGAFQSYIASMANKQEPPGLGGYRDTKPVVKSTPPEEVRRQAAVPRTSPVPAQAQRRPITGPDYSNVPQEVQRQHIAPPSQSAQLSQTARTTPTSGSNRAAATGASTGGSGGANVNTMATQAGQAASAPGAAIGDYDHGSGQTRTDFGNLFKPEAYNEAWADPEATINTYLQHKGAPTNTGGAAMTQDLGASMGLRFLLMNNGMSPTDLGSANYLDWAGQYLDNMRTPGGAAPGLGQIMEQVMNPGEDSVMYNNMYNNDMSAQQQVDAVLSTMRYGADGLAPSLVLQSMLSQASSLGEKYRANQLTGENTGNFGQFLQENGFRR